MSEIHGLKVLGIKAGETGVQYHLFENEKLDMKIFYKQFPYFIFKLSLELHLFVLQMHYRLACMVSFMIYSWT